MLLETERTRAIRRAMHDGYAPFEVRPAVRGDLFDRMEEPINYIGAAAIVFISFTIAGWALSSCMR